MDEALESYEKEIVHEITSETEDDLQENAQRVKDWLTQWKVEYLLKFMGLRATIYLSNNIFVSIAG